MTNNSPDSRLFARASKHGSAFTEQMAREAGFSRQEIEARLLKCEWATVFHGVFCPYLLRRNLQTLMHAALIYVGGNALISHVSAARLLGVEVPGPKSVVWVTVPHHVHLPQPSGIVITRTRHFPEPTWAQGFPITPHARIPVDLAMALEARPLLSALHEIVHKNLAPLEQIIGAAELMGGRVGAAAVRREAMKLDPRYDSMAELDAGVAYERAGIRLERQEGIHGDRGLIAIADFADPDLKYAVFIDGMTYHGKPDRQGLDRRQGRALRRLDWEYDRFTAEEVRENIDSVVQETRFTIEKLRRRKETAA